MPLPPYITHQLKDKNRYQTVYAEHDGSAAARQQDCISRRSLAQIEAMGVKIAHVTLHVGLGNIPPGEGGECAGPPYAHSEFI